MHGILAASALALALLIGTSAVTAHESAISHVHVTNSIAPDYEWFYILWQRDIPFAEIPGVDPNLLSLDIYSMDPTMHTPQENAPVFVYVHGGGGTRGDKAWPRDLGEKPVWFPRKLGMLFVSINYRLGDAGAYPAAQQDVANAVAWVHDHIAEFGGDPDRIVLAGHSAGASLVSRVATNDSFLNNAGKDLTILKGAITIDGGGFNALSRADTPAGRASLVETYGPDRSDWEAASPLHIATRQDHYIPDWLLLHVGNFGIGQSAGGGAGGSESDAMAMAAALRSSGHKATLAELIGKDHFGSSVDIGRIDDPVTLAVQRFLAEVVGVRIAP